jgi:hypothetical protein
MIPVQPDSWDAVQKSPEPGLGVPQPTQNSNLGSGPQPPVSQGQFSVSNENFGGNKTSNIEQGGDWGASANQPAQTNDWLKKADTFAKELGESNANQWRPESEQKVEVSNDNFGGNKASNIEQVGSGGDQWGASVNQPAQTNDWLKKADTFAKELGESNANQSYDAGTNDSYYNNSSYDNSSYNNSSSNNRYGNSSGCRNCGQEGL